MRSRRDSAARKRKGDDDAHGRAHRVRPTRVEPSSFAWIEPLDDLEPVVVEKVVEKEVVVEKPVIFEKIVEKVVEKPAPAPRSARVRMRKPGEPLDKHAGKTIIIGRGPSFAERLARSAPNPKPVLAGAFALIVALTGVALISPSSDRATAARSTAPLGVSEGSTGPATPSLGLTDNATSTPDAAARNPFAAKGFKPTPPPSPKAKPAGNGATGRQGATGRGGQSTPANAKPSLYSADFITYSTYTPWTNVKRRSGGWIQFGGKPTVRVVSVTDKAVQLFVVSDVDVVKDRSRGYAYNYPLRIVALQPGGVVRFADYRDIQGQDVEYTIRFRGSLPVNLTPAG